MRAIGTRSETLCSGEAGAEGRRFVRQFMHIFGPPQWKRILLFPQLRRGVKPTPRMVMDENLQRLRSQGLGTKRSLALRGFALGIEALERFARKEPLRRIHERVIGVLALESEPVDPRL